MVADEEPSLETIVRHIISHAHAARVNRSVICPCWVLGRARMHVHIAAARPSSTSFQSAALQARKQLGLIGYAWDLRFTVIS
jgi:hypothetical protein